MSGHVEAYIMIGNTKISGDDLTAYHAKHGTSSYHCIKCGAEIKSPIDYVCENCGFGKEK